MSIDEKDNLSIWFWNNAEDFIEHINRGPSIRPDGRGFLRLETHRPLFFAVLLNTPTVRRFGQAWKLITMQHAYGEKASESNARVRSVVAAIEEQTHELHPAVIFVLPMHATDTTPFDEMVDHLWESVGFPIEKEDAEECGLPQPGHWAVTNEEYIGHLMNEIGHLKNPTTDVLKDLTFKRFTADPDRRLVQEERDEVVDELMEKIIAGNLPQEKQGAGGRKHKAKMDDSAAAPSDTESDLSNE